jgi:hypothetical protein
VSDQLPVDDPRFGPAVEMIGRTGAEEFQIRYCEEEQPVIWMCSARWGDHWETAAALNPLTALFRLCDLVVDGGRCTHCERPTGFSQDFQPMFLSETLCWYSFDPELRTFRRSCEGVAP